MHPVALAFALVASPTQGPLAPPGGDTALTVQGFLQQDDQVGVWTIVVPLPVQALGARTFVVPVVGKADRWSRFLNRYVEATGRVSRLPPGRTPAIGLDVSQMKEVEPPATARKRIDRGAAMSAVLRLSVIPNRFAWRDTLGKSTGVNPLVLYSIANEHAGPIAFVLPTNDLLCVAVRPLDRGGEWDSTLQALRMNRRRFVVSRGGVFREAMQLPEAATPWKGRYVAQVGICAVADYDITSEFEVQ